jgi:hypothetical protein
MLESEVNLGAKWNTPGKPRVHIWKSKQEDAGRK